jgi:hypothetical protein
MPQAAATPLSTLSATIPSENPENKSLQLSLLFLFLSLSKNIPELNQVISQLLSHVPTYLAPIIVIVIRGGKKTANERTNERSLGLIG